MKFCVLGFANSIVVSTRERSSKDDVQHVSSLPYTPSVPYTPYPYAICLDTGGAITILHRIFMLIILYNVHCMWCYLYELLISITNWLRSTPRRPVLLSSRLWSMGHNISFDFSVRSTRMCGAKWFCRLNGFLITF
jgi:hypothetical protein